MNRTDYAAIYRGLNIDGILATAADFDVWSFSRAFSRAAAEASSAADPSRADLLTLLAAVTRVQIDTTDPSRTFCRLYLYEQERPLPTELSDTRVEQLHAVLLEAQNPLLRARIQDILWHSRKDHALCRAAAIGYLDLADQQAGSVINQVENYRRGAGLARSLGWNQPLFIEAKRRIVSRAHSVAAANTPGPLLCRLLWIIERYADMAQINELIPSAIARAEDAFSKSALQEAEDYWGIAIALQEKASDQGGVIASRTRLAECFIARAEQLASAENPQFMNAAHWMSRGIEQLQRLSSSQDTLRSLRIRLRSLQNSSLAELRPIHFPKDIAQNLEREREHNRTAVQSYLTGKPLQSALICLATGIPLDSVRAIEEVVLRMAREAPLQAMIAGAQLDDRGRTTATVGGLSLNVDQAEATIRDRCYRHAKQWVWDARADQILTGIDVIATEHAPQLEDLMFLADSSPWVVQGHEEIVMRGLLAGVYGDWLTASHFLVPQFEASIRSMLDRMGVIVSSLEDGIEEDLTLKALLNLPECLSMIGPDLDFALRGLLVEKVGFNFRNQLAHGLLSSGASYSPPAVLSWWLTLRLCVIASETSRVRSGAAQEPASGRNRPQAASGSGESTAA